MNPTNPMNPQTRARTAQSDAFALPNEAYALAGYAPGGLTSDEPEARARLGRYARLQFRDFAMHGGLAMVLIALVLAVPIAGMGNASTRDVPFAKIVETMFTVVAAVVIPAGTLLTMRGIVSSDTQHGYHRFLFSKPLDVSRYYAQSFGVQFVGFLATLSALLLPFLLVSSLPVLGVIGFAALFFALVGSISFLYSTLTRHDTAMVMLTGLVTSLVTGVSQMPEFRFLRPLKLLLPPLDRLADIMQHLNPAYTATHFSLTGSLIWVLGYAAACFAAAIAILRRRAVSA